MAPPHDASARTLRRSLADVTDTMDVINQTASTLLASVPADVWCGVVVDPATLLDTGGEHRDGFPAEVMPRLFEIEHAEQDDIDCLRALVRRPEPVSLLSASTKGDLESSKYYREILQPLRLADEMRVLLRDGGRTWGLLVMCREESSAPYRATDMILAASLAAPASVALRRSLLVGGIDRGGVHDAPGVVTVHADNSTSAMSPTAQQWFEELGGSLPIAVLAVVGRARGGAVGQVTTSRARTRAGVWVTLHAWRNQDATVMVSVGRSQPGELVAIILDAYGLTPRERAVAQLVLIGRSTSEISNVLGLSAHTVQDHLKAIFDKTGVHSRRELVADLFMRHYLPQLQDPATTKDGRLYEA